MAVREQWAETAMGVVVLALAAGFLTYSLSVGGVDTKRGSYEISAKFGEAGSLAPGAAVSVAGVKVGTVSQVTLEPKTYLAVAKAVEALEAGKVGRIVLSRPAVEAGESIGFLPGDMEDKLAPYLRPLYDALSDRLSMKQIKALMAEGLIEIAPVGYMRGRTLNNAFIVVDEAQNCTYVQLKMLLTRLGWRSTMVVTGDPQQSDLLPGISGLSDISARLEAVPDIAVVRLAERDIVRHPLVASMIGVL